MLSMLQSIYHNYKQCSQSSESELLELSSGTNSKELPIFLELEQNWTGTLKFLGTGTELLELLKSDGTLSSELPKVENFSS